MTLASIAPAQPLISSTSPASTPRCAAVASWKKTCAIALLRDQFYLVYQPQISYRDHRVSGRRSVDSLAAPRARAGTTGPVHPAGRARTAPSSPSANGCWTRPASNCATGTTRASVDLRMAVNLSTVQLHHAELPRVVNNLMQMYRLPPRSLELEVTETGLMEDISTAAQHLLSLRRSGALIAIDDFGTGYSSLSYLKKPAAGQDQDRQELRPGPAR